MQFDVPLRLTNLAESARLRCGRPPPLRGHLHQQHRQRFRIWDETQRPYINAFGVYILDQPPNRFARSDIVAGTAFAPEDIAFIYLHLPQKLVAARAAEQARFWDLHDQLLVHQTLLDDASLVEHVVASQLDLGQHLWDLSTQAPRRECFFSQVRTAGHVEILITRSIRAQGQPIPARTTPEQITGCLRIGMP